jgi:hypothetical protein
MWIPLSHLYHLAPWSAFTSQIVFSEDMDIEVSAKAGAKQAKLD